MLFFRGYARVTGICEGKTLECSFESNESADGLKGMIHLRTYRKVDLSHIKAGDYVLVLDSQISSGDITKADLPVFSAFAKEIKKVKTEPELYGSLVVVEYGRVGGCDGIRQAKSGREYIKFGVSVHLYKSQWAFVEMLIFTGLEFFSCESGDHALVHAHIKNISTYRGKEGDTRIKMSAMSPEYKLVKSVDRLATPAPTKYAEMREDLPF